MFTLQMQSTTEHRAPSLWAVFCKIDDVMEIALWFYIFVLSVIPIHILGC